jgi:UDP-N-acetyl-D-mannosaminuronic acid dehydrogenase
MPLPQSFPDRRVCILGMGYVGLTLAVAMADTGFDVYGVEIRDEVLDQLAQGKAHFWEPRLDEKLKRVIAKGRFKFGKDIDPSFGADVYVLTVGTPLDKTGKAFLGSVERSAGQVAGAMRDGALVILRSTVKLGTARNVVAPILAATGRSFDLAVCPERTLEGKALIELHELPQIIGADSPDTRARCQRLFAAMTHTTVALSSLEAAELTKLIDNTYRDVMFGFANEVARLCSAVGLSATEIIRAGKLGYPRTNVALPGPVGGPCLEKDPHILAESARAAGVDMRVTMAARSTNELQPSETVGLIKAHCQSLAGFPAQPVITLAGLAFKGVPATDDLRGTMAYPIRDALRAAFPGATLRGYDPVVSHDDISRHMDLPPCASLAAAFDGANIVVIANNHPQFQGMDVAALAGRMAAPGLIYDYWNMHDDTDDAMPSGVRYLGLGRERIGA